MKRRYNPVFWPIFVPKAEDMHRWRVQLECGCVHEVLTRGKADYPDDGSWLDPITQIYRAKISIYLDTADFGTPLMVDASEMMEFLPVGIDQASFVEKTGHVRPGSEALWVEAEVPEGLPSRPNVRRIGAMVHRSKTRTSFMAKPFTGADHEYWIEAYLRDTDGLSTRLEQDLRFRLDDRAV